MESMTDPNFEENEELVLPVNHPGLNDSGYIRRRKMFYLLARDLRLRCLGSIAVPYTAKEKELWRIVNVKLKPLHQKYACSTFLDGLNALRISSEAIPQLPELHLALQARTGFSVVPAEGLLAGKSYFAHWARGEMPCTQFLRHFSQPGYTPEPDMVHDVLGHVPPLMNQSYCDILRQVGRIALKCDAASMEKLIRFYWFTLEFGLLCEDGAIKILGAGILSSTSEILHALSDDVVRIPFSMAEVIQTAFNPNEMQTKLFILSSLDSIHKGLREFEKLQT